MTDKELESLVAARARHLSLLSQHLGPLRSLAPEKRAAVERHSAAFRAADAEITAELRRRGRPVVLADGELHLTADRLNFVTLVPGTRQAKGHYAATGVSNMQNCTLFRYPEPERPQKAKKAWDAWKSAGQ